MINGNIAISSLICSYIPALYRIFDKYIYEGEATQCRSTYQKTLHVICHWGYKKINYDFNMIWEMSAFFAHVTDTVPTVPTFSFRSRIPIRIPEEYWIPIHLNTNTDPKHWCFLCRVPTYQ